MVDPSAMTGFDSNSTVDEWDMGQIKATNPSPNPNPNPNPNPSPRPNPNPNPNPEPNPDPDLDLDPNPDLPLAPIITSIGTVRHASDKAELKHPANR